LPANRRMKQSAQIFASFLDRSSGSMFAFIPGICL
jgi:hypothetical protein